MPNSSIPFAASSAPIILRCCRTMTPDAPRVVIQSTEYNIASASESTAPSNKYAPAQSAASMPCSTASIHPVTPVSSVEAMIMLGSRPASSLDQHIGTYQREADHHYADCVNDQCQRDQKQAPHPIGGPDC